MDTSFFSNAQEQVLLAEIDPNKIPSSIGIIMDGNGRWAKERSKPRIFGHQVGVRAVREAIEACNALGVKFLTIYSFSSENWSRPEDEVSGLMKLFAEVLSAEIVGLKEKNVRIRVIGDLSVLPERTQDVFAKGVEETKENTGLTLVIAVNYGARDSIVRGVKTLAAQVLSGHLKPEEIDECVLRGAMETFDIADPDLIIRSSGEKRLSNFLLWEGAYSELYVTDELWPDFNRESLLRAIVDFQKRSRRFGGLN